MTIRRPLAMLCALGLTLAACGGSDDSGSDGVASLGDVATAGDSLEGGDSGEQPDDDLTGESDDEPVAADDAPSDPKDAMRAYDDCLRDLGIDLPSFDDLEGVDVEGEARGSEQAFEVDADQIEQMEQCDRFLENIDLGFDLDPEQQAQLDDANLQFARCMQSAGIDWPDPQPGNDGAFSVQIDSDVDDDVFDAALAECNAGMEDAMDGLDLPEFGEDE